MIMVNAYYYENGYRLNTIWFHSEEFVMIPVCVYTLKFL